MPALSSVLKHLVGAMRHPNEYRALIAYAVWRDPLHKITDNPEQSGWDRPEMKQCYVLLDATSRSFSAVIKELQGELVRVVTIFYLVLRALDTVEDDMTLPLDVKVPILEAFHEKLYQPGWCFTGSGPNEADRQVLIDFSCVIAEFGLLDVKYQTSIASIAKSMGHGMARYATLHATSPDAYAVADLPALDLYCHYVAGLVGEGLSQLFSASGLESPLVGEQVSLSNAMGLHLQKTNVMRDFCEDALEGRVFWPTTIWSKYAASPRALLAAPKEQKLWALSEMIVDALAHSTDSLDYLTLLKNQSVFNFCAIPQVMAIATLDVCFMNPAVFETNVKIRKGRAVQLIMGATNPRDVAYIFRDHVRSIHAKAVASDPSFLKICILAGRIEQWTENRYPSFVIVGTPAPTRASEWREGMDARIKQLTGPEDPARAAQRLRVEQLAQNSKMTFEDYKFMGLLLLGILLLVLLMVLIGGGAIYFLFIREGAPFYESVNAVEELVSEAAATVSATAHTEL